MLEEEPGTVSIFYLSIVGYFRKLAFQVIFSKTGVGLGCLVAEIIYRVGASCLDVIGDV